MSLCVKQNDEIADTQAKQLLLLYPLKHHVVCRSEYHQPRICCCTDKRQAPVEDATDGWPSHTATLVRPMAAIFTQLYGH